MLLLFASENTTAVQRVRSGGTGGPAPRLYAARYNAAGTTLYEMFDDIENIGVRWALPGGVQRIELTVRSRNRQEAFDRYRYNIGERIALFDDFQEQPIAEGWIYAGQYAGNKLTYICGGAWKRHEDLLVTTAPAATTDDTDVYLKNTVLAQVLAGGMDTTNIMSTGLDIGTYEIDTVRGTYPNRIIEDIIRMGDSAGAIIDYWVSPARFDGQLLQAPRAYLQKRDATVVSDWVIERKDISAMTLSRNAWNMRNHVTVYYGPTTTLGANANGGATTITVASAAAIAAEYEIEITLDSDRTHRTIVDSVSGTTVTLVDPVPNTGTNPTATSGNLVRVTNPLTASTTQDTAAQGAYWTRKHIEERVTFSSGQAGNLGTAMISALAYPAAEDAFTIGGNWIWDKSGRRWPIWRILTNPGVVEIADLAPDADLLSASIDRLRSFRVIAVDYDHRSRQARLVPDSWSGDQRIDVILQQLGANVGQMVGV